MKESPKNEGPQVANIYSRMKIDRNLKLAPHHLKEMVRVKVQQEAIPEQIKKGIAKADKQFGEYLKVNKNSVPYDFGAGCYVSEPRESRGNDLIGTGKNPILRQVANNEITILEESTD